MPEDQIIGIRYGLRGFYDRADKPVTLTRRAVDGIHLKGGTMLVGDGTGCARRVSKMFESIRCDSGGAWPGGGASSAGPRR